MQSKIDHYMRRATDILALLGGVGVMIMLVHIVAYVISRHVIASPIPATVEIVSQYYMVLIAFLPLAWAERRGEMISVEVFAQMFKGPVRKFNAAFVALVTTGAYAVLTYTTWLVAMREFAAKSYVISLNTAVPTWPSYFILPIAFALATIVCVSKLVLMFIGREDEIPAPRAPEEEFRQ